MSCTAKQLFQQAQLNDCLIQLQKEVRAAPADPSKRLFLFQLLALLGQWDRAQTQLSVISEMDPAHAELAGIYSGVVRANAARASVLKGHARPLVLNPGQLHDPQMNTSQSVDALLEGIRLDLAGDAFAANEAREPATRIAPTFIFSVNGSPPVPFQDSDARFATMLECIIGDQYVWLPLAAIQYVSARPPRNGHDLIWIPATIQLVDSKPLKAFLFARYPDSEASPDPLLVLGRRTDFDDRGIGLGQRVFDAGEEQVSALELRTLQASAAAEPPAKDLAKDLAGVTAGDK